MPGVVLLAPPAPTPDPGPPGALIVQEQQLELWRSETDRLLLGKDTPYGIISMKGLNSPPVRAKDVPKSDRDGDTAGIDTYAPREVWVELKVKGGAGTEQAQRLADLGRIVRRLRRGDPDVVFTWRGPGLPARRLTGRPRGDDWDYDWHTARGSNNPAGFRFVALDPIFYDAFEEEVVGHIAPGFPASIISVQNDGDMETEGIFEILGPAVNPRIMNTHDANRQLKIDITLSSADTLVIDQARRTITLDGDSVYGARRHDSQWFDLLPGTNDLMFSRTGTIGTAALTIRKRSAYSTVGSPLA